MIFLTIVVLPALSRPLSQVSRFHQSGKRAYSIKIRISLSFNLAFRKIDSILPFCRKAVVGCVALGKDFVQLRKMGYPIKYHHVIITYPQPKLALDREFLLQPEDTSSRAIPASYFEI